MDRNKYKGLLCIGDPHLASRIPGFRKDDYPSTILSMFRWALTYAETHSLLPVVLGDWFHYPRDNANRLLVELFDMLPKTILSIYGNHDCTETELGEDDTLSILVSSGCLRLLNNDDYWQGEINGHSVIIGGTPWGSRLPNKFDSGNAQGEKDCIVFYTRASRYTLSRL